MLPSSLSWVSFITELPKTLLLKASRMDANRPFGLSWSSLIAVVMLWSFYYASIGSLILSLLYEFGTFRVSGCYSWSTSSCLSITEPNLGSVSFEGLDGVVLAIRFSTFKLSYKDCFWPRLFFWFSSTSFTMLPSPPIELKKRSLSTLPLLLFFFVELLRSFLRFYSTCATRSCGSIFLGLSKMFGCGFSEFSSSSWLHG